MRLTDIDNDEIRMLLDRYGLELTIVTSDTIPGSYWGDEEAGLRDQQLFARMDTPVHSVLHESCHFVCMDAARRKHLDTDAAGDYAEENAVCYLQILLADDINSMGRERMMRDMDSWGYSFRLGSTRAWFEQDARDALQWLNENKLVKNGYPTYQLRQ